MELTEASLQQDDGKVFFYTGIANFTLLSAIFQLVEVAVKHTPQNGLSKFQEFLGFSNEAEIEFFSLGSCIRVLNFSFHSQQDPGKVADGAFWRLLKSQIVYPERRKLQKTTPQAFVDPFGAKVAVVRDSFEITIKRSSFLLPRSETSSQYKVSNTAEFLIGISPQGKGGMDDRVENTS